MRVRPETTSSEPCAAVLSDAGDRRGSGTGARTAGYAAEAALASRAASSVDAAHVSGQVGGLVVDVFLDQFTFERIEIGVLELVLEVLQYSGRCCVHLGGL